MTAPVITHLRHIDLAVPDFAKQLDFYTNTWGLTSEHTDTGLAFLAAEGSPENYIVRLREATDKRIDLISFGVASPADVDVLAAHTGHRRGPAGQRTRGDHHPRRGIRVPVLRQRGPHRRNQRRRGDPRSPRDRGRRVDPGPAVPCGDQQPEARTRPGRSTRSTWVSGCRTP